MSKVLVTNGQMKVAEFIGNSLFSVHVFANNEDFVNWRRLPVNRMKKIVDMKAAYRSGRRNVATDDHRNESIESVPEIARISLTVEDVRAFEIWDR